VRPQPAYQSYRTAPPQALEPAGAAYTPQKETAKRLNSLSYYRPPAEPTDSSTQQLN
jgi:hypothetical protein